VYGIECSSQELSLPYKNKQRHTNMQLQQRKYWPTESKGINRLIYKLHGLQMRRIEVNAKLYFEERLIEDYDPGQPDQDRDGLRRYFLHMEGEALDVIIKKLDDRIQRLIKMLWGI